MKYLLLALFLIFIVACSPQETKPIKEMTPELCESSGGNWNECGSLCAGWPPGSACPAVCNPQCDCGGIKGYNCPEGYKCKLWGGIADEIGVCIPN